MLEDGVRWISRQRGPELASCRARGPSNHPGRRLGPEISWPVAKIDPLRCEVTAAGNELSLPRRFNIRPWHLRRPSHTYCRHVVRDGSCVSFDAIVASVRPTLRTSRHSGFEVFGRGRRHAAKGCSPPPLRSQVQRGAWRYERISVNILSIDVQLHYVQNYPLLLCLLLTLNSPHGLVCKAGQAGPAFLPQSRSLRLQEMQSASIESHRRG